MSTQDIKIAENYNTMKKLLIILFLFCSVAYSDTPPSTRRVNTDTLAKFAKQFIFVKDTIKFGVAIDQQSVYALPDSITSLRNIAHLKMDSVRVNYLLAFKLNGSDTSTTVETRYHAGLTYQPLGNYLFRGDSGITHITPTELNSTITGLGLGNASNIQDSTRIDMLDKAQTISGQKTFTSPIWNAYQGITSGIGNTNTGNYSNVNGYHGFNNALYSEIGGGAYDTINTTYITFSTGTHLRGYRLKIGNTYGVWGDGQYLTVNKLGTWFQGSDDQFIGKTIPLGAARILVNENDWHWATNPIGLYGTFANGGIFSEHCRDTVAFSWQFQKRGDASDALGYMSYSLNRGLTTNKHGFNDSINLGWTDYRYYLSFNLNGMDDIRFNSQANDVAKRAWGNVSVDNGRFLVPNSLSILDSLQITTPLDTLYINNAQWRGWVLGKNYASLSALTTNDIPCFDGSNLASSGFTVSGGTLIGYNKALSITGGSGSITTNNLYVTNGTATLINTIGYSLVAHNKSSIDSLYVNHYSIFNGVYGNVTAGDNVAITSVNEPSLTLVAPTHGGGKSYLLGTSWSGGLNPTKFYIENLTDGTFPFVLSPTGDAVFGGGISASSVSINNNTFLGNNQNWGNNESGLYDINYGATLAVFDYNTSILHLSDVINVDYNNSCAISMSAPVTLPKITFSTLPPVYANNAAAISGGLTAGMIYRNGANPDVICVVH